VKVQLLYFSIITDPIFVETNLAVVDIKWNHNGQILAVCGKNNSIIEKDRNHVVFFSAFGQVSKCLQHGKPNTV
jgi:hypothetical protein